MTQFAIPTQAELVRQIDSFLLRHDMAPSRLSREATGEPSLVETIRNGRSPKLATVEKLMTFMAATDAEAETRAKLNAPLDALPPAPEEETELPFRLAPVNPTGASLPTSSPTNARPSPPEANQRCPSCSDPDEDETAGPLLPLVTGQTRAEGRTPGAPPVLSKSSFAGPPSTPTVAGDA